MSEDRLEFNDGDVWLKAPKVASAPRKRKVVEDWGGKKFRVFFGGFDFPLRNMKLYLVTGAMLTMLATCQILNP